MNIFFFTSWWPNDNKYSGIFIKEHAKAIAKYCNVYVLYVKFVNQWNIIPFKILTKEYSEADLHIMEVTINLPLPLRFSFLFNKLKKRIILLKINLILKRQTISLFHLNVLSKETLWLLDEKVLAKYKFVISEHSGYYFKEQHQLTGKVYELFKKQIKEQFEHKQLHMILPVSNSLKNVLKNEYNIRTMMRVIPNVVSLSLNDVIIRSNHKQKITVCLIANWEYPKCPELFLNTLLSLDSSVLNQIEIIWGGFGSQYEKMQQEEEYKKFNIQFVGSLSKNEVYALLAKSDMLVHPTLSESFSCIVMEALCFGLPVVSTQTGIMPEIIDETNGVIASLYNQKSFTEGFLKVFENINSGAYNYSKISKNALHLFSTNVVGESIYNVYQELLADK